MKRTEAKSIAEIIGDFMQQEDIEDAVLEQKALRLWGQVVGSGVNRMTTERFVDNGVITVKISSAPLRNDLMHGPCICRQTGRPSQSCKPLQ